MSLGHLYSRGTETTQYVQWQHYKSCTRLSLSDLAAHPTEVCILHVEQLRLGEAKQQIPGLQQANGKEGREARSCSCQTLLKSLHDCS